MIRPSQPDDDPHRARDLAWAEAFAGLARVAMTLSGRLRAIHGADSPAAPAAAPAAPAPDQSRPAATRLPRGGLGPQQQAVLALGGLDSELGMTTGEVAHALGFVRSNTHRLLVRLQELGALEAVPDERPARWRRASP